MPSYTYTIRLTSDAEPGTGLGGEIVNEFVPRDHRGNWIIRGSHAKGLMRQSIQDMIDVFASDDASPWNATLLDRVFGKRDETRPGVEASFQITDAVSANGSTEEEVKGEPRTRRQSRRITKLVTRTAVDDSTGVAQDASLRTTESVPCGTVFAGQIYSHVEQDSVEDIAWRLGLLSIPAVGSSRSRGCGACVVDLQENGKSVETRSPGQLLEELDRSLRVVADEEQQGTVASDTTNEPSSLSDNTVVLRLVFEAQTPICCPEIPDKTNVISTGFSIPASAIQGVILNRINRRKPALADELYSSPRFRAWPLQPCRMPDGVDPSESDGLISSTRVSLTHRMAKFSVSDKFQEDDFQDEAIQPYDWKATGSGAPLKASDGVLLRWASGTVRLWKAAEMPRVITSHGVHNDPETADGRNLFTVESIAPMTWQGIIVLPENAADELEESLKRDPIVAVGKSRTVRGIGRLSASRIEAAPPEWQPNAGVHTILVAQSPLLLPESRDESGSSEDELAAMAKDWAETHGLPAPEFPSVHQNSSQFKRERSVWANAGIRFGWNRHTTRSGRLDAVRVVLPGSVILFSETLDGNKLASALQSGIGAGRERGFGAVSVHPGKASGLYPVPEKPRPLVTVKASPIRDAVELALEMPRLTNKLPSPSQIRAVQQQLEKSGRQSAKEYFERQLTGRTSRIWFTWEPIREKMNQLLDLPDENAVSRALVLLANLAITAGKEGN